MKHYTKMWLAGVLVLAVVFGVSEFVRIEKNTTEAAVQNWQRGVSIIPQYPTDFQSDNFKQSVRDAKAVGANYVTLIIPLVQSSEHSTDVQKAGNTPTDEALASAIQYIHSQGMSVNLKPHVDIYTDWSRWRANINPSDRAGWFRAYGDLLVHYAKLGQANGAEMVTVGSELIMMATSRDNPTNTANWLNLISKVRGVYNGKLTYSANWGAKDRFADEVGHIEFWNALDYVGSNGYFPIPGSNVSDYVKSWGYVDADRLKPIYEKTGKQILFTEVGYRSVDGIRNYPFDWSAQGPFDEQEQADLYEAMIKYWSGVPYFVGFHIWEWSSNPNAGGQGDTGYTPQNKKAEQVLKNYFASTPQTPPPQQPPATTTPPVATTTPPIATTTPPVATTTPPVATSTPPVTPPPPTNPSTIPAPTASASCVNNAPKLMVSWQQANMGSKGYWVNIDTDNNWNNGFWHRFISDPRTTQVDAKHGFWAYAGQKGYYSIDANKTYYIRVYYSASGKHSPTITVQTPSCTQVQTAQSAQTHSTQDFSQYLTN